MKSKEYIYDEINSGNYDISIFLDFNNKDELIHLIIHIIDRYYYFKFENILYSSISTFQKLDKEDWKIVISQLNKEVNEKYHEEYHVGLFRILRYISRNCFMDRKFLLYIGFSKSLINNENMRSNVHLVVGFIGPLTSIEQKIQNINKKTLPNITDKEKNILYFMFTDCLNIKIIYLKEKCRKVKNSFIPSM